jgi:hypothetical protein
VSLELDPGQTEPVATVIAQLLADPERAVDPWWSAGLADALRSSDGAAAEDPWSGTGVVEP